MNSTLQNFISELIRVLQFENKYREDDDMINIPFTISTLSQNFTNDEEKYKEFINDLKDGYSIVISGYQPDDALIVLIYLDDCKNKYQLSFFDDDRYYGYCECTPDMPDYREDKKCCGHGCDTVFCQFTLDKIVEITNAKWQGDEHDYWEFEDEFYRKEKESLKEENRRKKELEIKSLRKTIEDATRKLMELEENYENRIN